MGFDLYDVESKSEVGDYFRNNVWWWRPLWDYVCLTCGDLLTAREAELGYFNDGVLIRKRKAERIADRLEGLLRDGKVKEYERSYREWQDNLPDEVCWLCSGTGKRSDELVQKWYEEATDKSEYEILADGTIAMTCNACGGSGREKAWAANYPFDEENVKEFIEFARNSGGFRIY